MNSVALTMRRFLPAKTAGLLGGLLLLFLTTPRVGARVVWIDTDLSLGSPLREVDDAYALLFAFRSPELQIAGLSTTYGNAPLRSTTERTRNLVKRLGLTTPVTPGAASPNDLGRPSAAAAALDDALRQNERLTYIALGPLTNLATFLRLHPERARQFEEVILVAGKTPEATLGFGPRESFRIHDANGVKDPAALRAILATRIPLVLAPIETSTRLLLTAQDLRALKTSGPGGRFLALKSGVWLWFWTNIARADGGPVFDVLAVLAAAQPALVATETRYAAMEGDEQLIVRPNPDDGRRKVRFCTGFARKTKAVIMRRLEAEKASR